MRWRRCAHDGSTSEGGPFFPELFIFLVYSNASADSDSAELGLGLTIPGGKISGEVRLDQHNEGESIMASSWLN